jgi:hypothetical protein
MKKKNAGRAWRPCLMAAGAMVPALSACGTVASGFKPGAGPNPFAVNAVHAPR